MYKVITAFQVSRTGGGSIICKLKNKLGRDRQQSISKTPEH